jgi:RHS repeat-associated protein
LFNGNISETLWRTSADNIKRKYAYQYDDLNRLLAADYSKPGLTSIPNNYAENINYDKNGNISALTRYGNSDSDGMVSANLIDNLKYFYDTNKGNVLVKVLDLCNSPQGFNETADVSTGDSNGINDQTNDYSYDENGNMTKDTNKAIESITYNHLNLPTKIVFSGTTNGTISYLYNALGQKVQKKVVDATTTNTTDYLTGFQYKNAILDFFPHAEGYVKFNYGRVASAIFRFSYVFNYTDHLGNIRVSYSKDPSTNVLKILEENHYYPFGLKHTNYNSDRLMYVKEAEIYKIKPVAAAVQTYKYKFQGTERQDELGLNWDSYKYRNYDYAIGRFMSIDPLTEEYHTWSPYVFSGNRVVDSRELEGLEPVNVTKNTKMLIITVNGSAGGINGDKITGNNTLVRNLPEGYKNNDDGLSMLGQKGWDVLNSQIVNYAGSEGGITASHIAETIGNYRETNPDGKVAIVGHSLGGKDALDAANLVNGNSDIKNKTIDLLITMEAATRTGPTSADGYSTEVGSNVKNLVNFTSASNSYPGSGGTAGSGTNVLNIGLPSGTTHTNMDNTLTRYLPMILHQTNGGKSPVNVINGIDFNKAKVLNNGDIKPNATGGSSY